MLFLNFDVGVDEAVGRGKGETFPVVVSAVYCVSDFTSISRVRGKVDWSWITEESSLPPCET